MKTTYHLYGWRHGQALGGFDDFKAAFRSLPQAEYALLHSKTVDRAMVVIFLDDQPLMKTRYVLSNCWFDAQGCPHIEADQPQWVRIGDKDTPMRLVTDYELLPELEVEAPP